MIAAVFARLDYARLGPIYCDEGGAAFWLAKRKPCEALGVALAQVLLPRLMPGGRSLYVGAGVAEIPLLLTETLELGRAVAAYNLRKTEVALINRAVAQAFRNAVPCRVTAGDARAAAGRFDHLWIVSVLNDPERVPELAALSYGRANPVTFDPRAFARERAAVRALAARCLAKLTRPGLVTTSVEEIPWIAQWCARRRIPCIVEQKTYPTAIVEDPICFIRVGTAPSDQRRRAAP
ncbi:hypothetical protein [Nitrospira sp. Kam-Ns4a]